MIISDKTKKYIKECKDLIEEDNWLKIYSDMCPYLNPFQIGEFTSIMLNCGINPLFYMNRIPSFYLYNIKRVKEFKIPDHINTIGMSAFDMSGLEKIHIPSNINEILLVDSNEKAIAIYEREEENKFKCSRGLW